MGICVALVASILAWARVGLTPSHPPPAADVPVAQPAPGDPEKEVVEREGRMYRLRRWFFTGGSDVHDPPTLAEMSDDEVQIKAPRYISRPVEGKQLMRPGKEQAVEFKVAPETHAGYAATWFALSGAGAVMTRKLLRKMPK